MEKSKGETTKEDLAKEVQSARLIPSCRFTLGIMGFFGGIVINLMRNHLSVGIVCMTVDTPGENGTDDGGGNTTAALPGVLPGALPGSPRSFLSIMFPNYARSRSYCFTSAYSVGTKDGLGETGDFTWSDDLQGVILSSFAYGYIATQLLGGYLAGRFGAKKINFLGVALATVSTLVGPLCSTISPYLLVTTQILNGLGQGVYFPCYYHLWSKWAAPFERTKLINFLLLGNTLGTIISLFLSGYLCEYLGWESLFYVYGGASVVWCVAWLFLAYESPSVHPRISKTELEYLEGYLSESGVKGQEVLGFWDIPWKGLLTSKNIWVINLVAVCNGFGYSVAQKMLPQFMEDVLKLSISDNGLYSSLPHISTLFTTSIAAVIADFMIRKKVKVIRVRKLMQGLNAVGSLAFTIPVGFLSSNDLELAVFCLAAWLAMAGFGRAGAIVAVVEIAPRYAALAMGMCNTFGNAPGMVIPSIVAAMTPDGTQAEWRNVFFMTGGVYLFGGLVYLIFGNGNVEDWAKHDQTTDMKPDKSYTNPSFTVTDENIIQRNESKMQNGFENNYIEKTQL